MIVRCLPLCLWVVLLCAGLYLLSSCEDSGVEQKAAYGQLLTACQCLQRKPLACEGFTAAELEDTYREVLLAVCMVEGYLPANELVSKLHMLLHLQAHIKRTGPAWVTSMFVYESMWSQLVKWCTNMAAPELTLLRSIADYELAMFAYWTDPTAFDMPELTCFTDEFIAEAVHRYQLPIGDPASAPRPSTATATAANPTAAHATGPAAPPAASVQLKGLQNKRLDPLLLGRIRLALHQYYMEKASG